MKTTKTGCVKKLFFMDNNIYQALLNEVEKVFPKKSVMVNTLSDILRIEKSAVYRRLRQDVPFTFNEIVAIAKNLNISLDNLVDIENHISIMLQLQLLDYISPQASDYNALNLYIKFLKSLNKSGNSEMATITNVLPHDLFSGFDYLLKFYLFIWNYHSDYTKLKPFHQISITPEMNDLLNNYMIEMKNFNKTFYVFDNGVFRFFIDLVNYFNSIRLIEKEDVLKIKEDLHSMLDYLEKIAITGQFKETGNSVNIYISDIDITTCYTYFETSSTYLSMIKAFILSYITSLDKRMFEKTKRWIHALIKISTLITLTNEKQRVLYFEKQRKIVNEL